MVATERKLRSQRQSTFLEHVKGLLETLCHDMTHIELRLDSLQNPAKVDIYDGDLYLESDNDLSLSNLGVPTWPPVPPPPYAYDRHTLLAHRCTDDCKGTEIVLPKAASNMYIEACGHAQFLDAKAESLSSWPEFVALHQKLHTIFACCLEQSPSYHVAWSPDGLVFLPNFPAYVGSCETAMAEGLLVPSKTLSDNLRIASDEKVEDGLECDPDSVDLRTRRVFGRTSASLLIQHYWRKHSKRAWRINTISCKFCCKGLLPTEDPLVYWHVIDEDLLDKGVAEMGQTASAQFQGEFQRALFNDPPISVNVNQCHRIMKAILPILNFIPTAVERVTCLEKALISLRNRFLEREKILTTRARAVPALS